MSPVVGTRVSLVEIEVYKSHLSRDANLPSAEVIAFILLQLHYGLIYVKYF